MMMLLAQAVQTATNAQPDDIYLLWGFLLFGLAGVLLVVEMFIPSGGLIGALCGIAIIGSVVSFYKYDSSWGHVALGLYIVLTPISIVWLFKLWLHSPVAKTMILGGGDGEEEAGDDATYASEQARHERLNELRSLIGAKGVATTSLRPVGVVKIEGRRVDAMAESGTIEANTPVVVVDVYDNQIKVRPDQ